MLVVLFVPESCHVDLERRAAGPRRGWLTMLLFWALVVAAGVALVRHLSALPRGRAEELLAERFARGQIDEEEYARRLARLREHR
ncbi:SHOCT domain-containing protein [Streptomyces sp. NPDC015684]|uniref:SHOCT domain-containing protein n=2 Tax=Streptomyces TaxID=1883 RepID=UPI0036FD1AB0